MRQIGSDEWDGEDTETYREFSGESTLSVGQAATLYTRGRRAGRVCVYFKSAVERQVSS